jgi:DNA-directed RNA polymerase subunit E'/Rpb7
VSELTAGSVSEVRVDSVAGDKIIVSLKPRTHVQTSASLGQSITSKLPGDGSIMLSDLKCGMSLDAEVVSCTLYGAFLKCKVFRVASGGTFKPVNGFLHTSDIIEKHRLIPTRFGNSITLKQSLDELVIERGQKIRVFVKEVFKNSGCVSSNFLFLNFKNYDRRYTLTTDDKISKRKINELERARKVESKQRKQARRMRQQLDSLTEGDIIAGVIADVIPEGILVNIQAKEVMDENSQRQRFTIKGLIRRKDLPVEFTVPTTLRPDQFKDIIRQNFIINRKIKCSVLGLDGAFDVNAQYHILLLHENLGPIPEEDDDSPDIELEAQNKIMSNYYDDDDISHKGKNDFDAFEVETSRLFAANNDGKSRYFKKKVEQALDGPDEKNQLTLSDLNMIYEELKSKNSKLSVKQFESWKLFKKYLETKSWKAEDVHAIFASVIGSKKIGISVDEFSAILLAFDGLLKLIASHYKKEFNDQQLVSHIEPATKSLLSEKETYLEAEDIFDLLRGNSEYLEIEKLKQWQFLRDLQNGRVAGKYRVSSKNLADAITTAYKKPLSIRLPTDRDETGSDFPLPNSKTLNLSQFLVFYEALMSLASGDDLDPAFLECDTDIDETNHIDSANVDALEEDVDLSLANMAEELYDDLKGDAKSLTIDVLMKMDYIQYLMEAEILSRSDIESLVRQIVPPDKSANIDVEEFASILRKLDDITGDVDNDGEIDFTTDK